MSYEATLVRVWNDNTHPYEEEFKGKTIKIGANKFIEMEETEAVEFKGKFTHIKRDADGQPVPSGYKMLRIEKTSKSAHRPSEKLDFTCQACGFIAKNKIELDAHIDENHLDSLLDKDEADKRKKAIK